MNFRYILFLLLMFVATTHARGNISGMAYDGFDRLSLMKYPLELRCHFTKCSKSIHTP
jgi:YD repeat-containing protein